MRANQESTKSELQEVSCLLVIDDIVCHYCRIRAAELFCGSDPLHSLRLLMHISWFIHVNEHLQLYILKCDVFKIKHLTPSLSDQSSSP